MPYAALKMQTANDNFDPSPRVYVKPWIRFSALHNGAPFKFLAPNWHEAERFVERHGMTQLGEFIGEGEMRK